MFDEMISVRLIVKTRRHMFVVSNERGHAVNYDPVATDTATIRSSMNESIDQLSICFYRATESSGLVYWYGSPISTPTEMHKDIECRKRTDAPFYFSVEMYNRSTVFSSVLVGSSLNT